MPQIPGRAINQKNPNAMYLGLDPGGSGGIVVLRGFRAGLINMPDDDVGIWKEIKDIATLATTLETPPIELQACIEYIHTGFKGSSKNSIAKLYGNYCKLKMALIAAGIPTIEVTAQVWHKALGITPKGKEEGKTHWKNRLKEKAHKLFPNFGKIITLKTCDALLIAEYCRRKHEGTL